MTAFVRHFFYQFINKTLNDKKVFLIVNLKFLL